MSTLAKSAQDAQSAAATQWQPPSNIAYRTGSSAAGGGISASRASIPGEVVSKIASQALAASENALSNAANDVGFRFSFYLLTQIALASRRPDWYEYLNRVGIKLTSESTAFDLTSEFQEVVDRHIYAKGRPTDVSEMAQKAAGQVLCGRVGARAETLFGNSGPELQNAVRAFSTKSGFADIGRRFFSFFLTRFLNFYLSRITATQLGTGSLRELGDITEFNSALERHCYESAAILPDFLGEWYSKTEYMQGIDLNAAGSAAAFALKKLQEELARQRQGG